MNNESTISPIMSKTASEKRFLNLTMSPISPTDKKRKTLMESASPKSAKYKSTFPSAQKLNFPTEARLQSPERNLQHPLNFQSNKSHRSRKDPDAYGLTLHYLEERWSWDDATTEVSLNQFNLGPDLIALLRDTCCLPPSSISEFKEMRFMDQRTVGSADVNARQSEDMTRIKKKCKVRKAKIMQ